jgi:hypothetical protein
MCGGGSFTPQAPDGFGSSKPQPGQFKPMDMGQQGPANSPFTFYTPPAQAPQMKSMQSPFQDMGQAGGNMYQRPQQTYNDMGSAGGNMAWGGDGWTPPPFQYGQTGPSMFPPQGGMSPMGQGQTGGNMYQPPQQPAFGGFSPGQGLQPYQAGYQPQNSGQTWDPPKMDFAPGGGFFPTTTPTNIPSVTAGWMGLGGQAPNPNMSYNPQTRQWGYPGG